MLNRRKFIAGVGGGSLLAGAAALGNSLWKKPSEKVLLDRKETWAKSVCQLCPSGCGLKLRLCNGSPVTVSGNPLHPVNRGGLCARGGAALQLYYDPDRFKGPVRRDPSARGGWAAAAWDEGLAGVAKRLKAAGGGRVALVRAGGHDFGSQLLGRLVRACASDWIVDADSTGSDATAEAVRLMHGVDSPPVHDLARADCVASFDSGLLESSPRCMTLHRGFAEMRAAGGRFIHASPRMGVTGTKADPWLPIRPATAGILALGVAHIILKEGLADAAFLDSRALHFEDWTDSAGNRQPGVRNWILREFSPQRVAEAAGIGPEDVVRTARTFGSAGRPLALGPVGAATDFSLFDLLAVHTLNAVVGAIDVPGGVLLGRRPPFEPFDRPESAAGTETSARRRTIEELARWIVDERQPAIDLVIVHGCDPVFTSPHGELIASALKRVPFVVSTSPVPNDTTELAHLVLPDALTIERRCEFVSSDGNGYPVVSVSPAAVKPRAEGRHSGEVALELARLAGEPVSGSFPWQAYEEVVADRVRFLLDSGAGGTFSDEHRSTWAQMLERSGWRIPDYHSADELLKGLEESGGWWDPVYYHGEWRRVLAFDGQKIDFEPVRQASAAGAFMVPAQPAEGSVWLHVFREAALDTGVGASLPYLQDLGSPLSEPGWCSVVEINPETARHLGIAHRDRVAITNAGQVIAALASVTQGIRPEVVALGSGSGRVAGGRFSSGVGANPLRLLGSAAGGPVMVRIQKA